MRFDDTGGWSSLEMESAVKQSQSNLISSHQIPWNKKMNWLVVKPPLWKRLDFVNWDDEIPNIWKNKTCFKPPTRWIIQTISEKFTMNAGHIYWMTWSGGETPRYLVLQITFGENHHCYWEKLTISMAMFNSDFKLSEGRFQMVCKSVDNHLKPTCSFEISMFSLDNNPVSNQRN